MRSDTYTLWLACASQLAGRSEALQDEYILPHFRIHASRDRIQGHGS